MKLLRLLKKELAGEALLWVEKGLIARDQASRILELYETELPEDDGGARGYTVLMTLAGMFMGLAGLVLLETNTQPGMTPTSLAPEQALACGMSFGEVCRWMVEDASCNR